MVQYPDGRLDASFAALSDATRRGVLERLGRGDASISDLAEAFHMTLTGMRKHVGVLEHAELVTTEKVGRVRTCRVGPRRLEDETASSPGSRSRSSGSIASGTCGAPSRQSAPAASASANGRRSMPGSDRDRPTANGGAR